jgi:hypothetical protein
MRQTSKREVSNMVTQIIGAFYDLSRAIKAKNLRFLPAVFSILSIILILGLTLTIVKQIMHNKNQPAKEEMVLTNMAFYVGLHFWEIIATISCTNLCTFNF